jgi:uncharacterized protein YndB with AHSA1/START domain
MPAITDPAFTSELFHAITRASPECVWNELTNTGSPADWLFGMTVESNWQPGAAITMTVLGDWCLTGEILAVDPPGLLCYTLGDQPGEPSVYIKWEIRGTPGGTFIRLYVDEPWSRDEADLLEAAWVPVLSRLVANLDQFAEQHGAA